MSRCLVNSILPYLLVYVFCIQVIVTNSKTSTLWKLNKQSGLIQSHEEKGRYVSVHYCVLDYIWQTSVVLVNVIEFATIPITIAYVDTCTLPGH